MTTQEWGAVSASKGPDQALALELVRATETAAIESARWVGRGQQNSRKTATATALHERLMFVPMCGVVVIGDDDSVDTPLLCTGDEAGFGDSPLYDLGIGLGGPQAPLQNAPSALVSIVVAERGALNVPSQAGLVDMLAVGPDCVDVVDITQSVATNLWAIAAVKRIRIADVEVAVPDRSRQELVNEVREAGPRFRVPQGGGIPGAIAAAWPDSSVDLLLGTGTAAESVIAAAAVSCLGGSFQIRLRTGGVEEVLRTDDLVRGERVLFSGTAVTASELLRGVRYKAGRVTTQSIVLCSRPETSWTITSEHRHP